MSKPTYRDKLAGGFKLCSGGCGGYVLPPKRKCTKCRKTDHYTIISGVSISRGRNKRGIASHKPDKIRTKRAKRQHPEVMGSRPEMRISKL